MGVLDVVEAATDGRTNGVAGCGRDLGVSRDRENDTFGIVKTKERGIVTAEGKCCVDGGLLPAWL